MKAKSTRHSTRSRGDRNTGTNSSPANSPASRIPRCTRCGSRTVHFEKMHQELLATISLHCLMCGHHMFLGKPVVRLLRRPTIPKARTGSTMRTAVSDCND